MYNCCTTKWFSLCFHIITLVASAQLRGDRLQGGHLQLTLIRFLLWLYCCGDDVIFVSSTFLLLLTEIYQRHLISVHLCLQVRAVVEANFADLTKVAANKKNKKLTLVKDSKNIFSNKNTDPIRTKEPQRDMTASSKPVNHRFCRFPKARFTSSSGLVSTFGSTR